MCMVNQDVFLVGKHVIKILYDVAYLVWMKHACYLHVAHLDFLSNVPYCHIFQVKGERAQEHNGVELKSDLL